MKLSELTDAPEKVLNPTKASEPEPVYRPGGATVVILNDDYTPFEVVIEAIVASTNLSVSEATKRMHAAHTKGFSPIASYASRDVAETVAENIMKHARANRHYDHYRAHPHFRRLGNQPWPLQAEVMDADQAK
jgi:ATP-dependent Clp protease adapter protein ClpS